MWWPCLFLILSVYADVNDNDVKDDYYYPNTQAEFPVLPDQIKPRRADTETNIFEITGQYEYKTHFVYGPDKLFEFQLEYFEKNGRVVTFQLEFDMPNGNRFKFELSTVAGYVVNLKLNEYENGYICSGSGTIKIVSFKIDFDKEWFACDGHYSKFMGNSLKPVDFDTEKGLKIGSLKVSWNVGTAKWVWRFPATAIPFRKIDKPKTTTIARTKPATTIPPVLTTDEKDEDATEEKQSAKAGFPIWGYVIIVAAVFIVIAAVIAVVIIIKKRKTTAKLSGKHLPPDPFTSEVQTQNKPTESADKPMSTKSTVTKHPSSVKSASAPPSHIKPVNAPASTPAPPSAPEVDKTESKKSKIDKTAEMSIKSKADIKPEQSPENSDKPAKKTKTKQQSQRTDEVFT